MSKTSILGASEAEKLQFARWPKYCETPCKDLAWSLTILMVDYFFLKATKLFTGMGMTEMEELVKNIFSVFDRYARKVS